MRGVKKIGKYLMDIFLAILIFFNLLPTAFAAVIPYNESLIPQLYFDGFFVSKPIDGKCPIGKEQQVISNYAEINIDSAKQTQMGVCLAKKSQKEQLQNTILNATDLGKVSQQVSGYQLAIDIPCSTIAGGQCPKITGLASYMARLYQFGLMIAGLAAFGSIIYGALKYILSAGSFSSTEEAKDQITQAIYGLILLLGAFLVLYTINPRLIILSDPNAPIIDVNQIINQGQDRGGQNNQILSGGGIAEDPLCSVGSYPGLSLTIGGKEQINQSFKCSQCVNGASIQNNKCQCNSGLEYNPKLGYCK